MLLKHLFSLLSHVDIEDFKGMVLAHGVDKCAHFLLDIIHGLLAGIAASTSFRRSLLTSLTNYSFVSSAHGLPHSGTVLHYEVNNKSLH